MSVYGKQFNYNQKKNKRQSNQFLQVLLFTASDIKAYHILCPLTQPEGAEQSIHLV